MAEQMTLRGTLKGHSGWVTSIVTTENPDVIVSGSRGKFFLSFSSSSVNNLIRLHARQFTWIVTTSLGPMISDLFDSAES